MLITRAVASTTVIVASASTVSPLRSQTDIDDLVSQNPAEFLWDIVFVDEGQDWPVNEIEILRSIYSPERIIVADGVDQFVLRWPVTRRGLPDCHSTAP